jgi:hypothetical protein
VKDAAPLKGRHSPQFRCSFRFTPQRVNSAPVPAFKALEQAAGGRGTHTRGRERIATVPIFADFSEPEDAGLNVAEYLSDIGAGCWVGDLPLGAFASEIERFKNGESDPERLAIIAEFEDIARTWAEAGGPPKITRDEGLVLIGRRPLATDSSRPANWDDATFQATARPKRRRQPSRARAIAEAKRAGAASVTVDGVTYRFGAADAAAAESNPFELEARRLRRQRGAV